VLTTNDNSRAARLDDVSITYGPVAGVDDDDADVDDAGTGGSANASSNATPTAAAGLKPRSTRKAQRQSGPSLISKAGGSGVGGPGVGGGGRAAAVDVGGYLPPGMVEASGQLLGRTSGKFTGAPGDGDGTGGRAGGAGGSSGGAMLFLGGIYALGFATSPLQALWGRLIVGWH